MAAAGTSVTVVGPRGAADLTLPAQVPLVILLPDIVAMLAPGTAPRPPASWRLRRSVGGDLNPHATIAANQVAEGAVLLLVDAAETNPAPLVRDLVEAVEDAADRAARWSPTATRGAVAGLTGLLALGTAVFWTLRQPPHWPAVGACAAVALLLPLFVLLARRRLEQPVALAIGWSAVALAALAGLAAGRLLDQPGGILLLLAGAAVAVVGALLAGAARWLRVITAAALPAGLAAVAAGLAIRLGAPGVGVAAVLGALVPFGYGLVPALATALSGVLGLPDTVTGAGTGVPDLVAAASRYAGALLAGLTLPLLLAIVALTRSADRYALVLAAVLTLALLLAGRSFSGYRQVLPLLFGAAGGALAVQARLLSEPGTPRLIGTLVTGVLLGLALLVVALRLPATARTQLKPWLGRAELVTLAAAPLLVLGVLGVYGAVADRLG